MFGRKSSRPILPRWNVKHLAFAREVADLGSISAAADRFEVSQSTISGALDNVESAFGIRMFRRIPGRGLILTSQGEALMGDIRDLLEKAEKLEDLAESMSNRIAGTIRMGCFPTAVPHVVPEIMGRLRQRYPAISLEMQESTIGEMCEQLSNGDLDVALTYNAGLDASVEFESLFPVYQHVALSSDDPLASENTVSLELLSGKPMILLDIPVCKEYILDAYKEAGLSPKILFKTGSTSVIENLVASGQGYSMLAFRPSSDNLSKFNRLRFIRVSDELPRMDFGLAIARDAKPSKTLKVFVKLIRELAPGWTFH